ncbi:MAG: hypothetical protein KDI32_08820 [Pseudomonadales bacterium]|nr:hypothetical protein [Pseudomonadales bacterium]
MNTTILDSAKPLDQSLVTYTHVIYALHALAVVIGLTSAATIVGTFVWSVPSIIAVVMNYARRSDARGTILESHFTWQIRTFWFTVLWAVIISAISFPLVLLLGLGILTFWLGFGVLGIWVLYRVLRGWLALRDARPMYV